MSLLTRKQINILLILKMSNQIVKLIKFVSINKLFI